MRTRLLYITSPSYSGSTLLTILLAEHTSVSTIGELKASAFGDIEQYHCSCGERLGQCAFWRDLDQQIKAQDPSFDLHHWQTHFKSGGGLHGKVLASALKSPLFEWLRDIAIRLLPGLANTKAAILRNNQRVIDTVVASTRTDAFIDGSKDPIRARYLLEADRWDCSIITLIRDGRGFCNSYMRHMSAPMSQAVSEWKAKVREMEYLQRIAGDRSIVVRYEDLCEDPLPVVNRILGAASLAPLDALNFPLSNNNRHIFGNAMRLKEIDAVVADEKWRARLSEADLKLFYAEAGEINDRYGYTAH